MGHPNRVRGENFFFFFFSVVTMRKDPPKRGVLLSFVLKFNKFRFKGKAAVENNNNGVHVRALEPFTGRSSVRGLCPFWPLFLYRRAYWRNFFYNHR